MNALLSSLMLWAVFLPFAGALLLLFLKNTPNLRDTLMVAVSLLTAAAVLSLLFFYDPEHAAPSAFLFTLIQPTDHLSIAFHLEPLGLLFATLASCLWVITGLYAIGYMRANDEKNQTAFFAYFSIAIGSALGIAFAANMLTLFVFYEILTLSTYPLVIHHQTEDAKKGGRFYLTYLLGSSFLFLFLGMIWTWIRAGSLDFTIGGILPQSMSGLEAGLLLALYVFGIGKAALMPVHRWLPEAMVAPTPVSALLHAVAVVKAGVFTVLKVGLYIFGADFLSQKGASEWLIGVACFSILAASVIALTKTDLKARLAYSTVSQLSYVTLAMALATPAAFLAGALHIASHAFAKVSLFMCAGAIHTATHQRDISQMDGLGRVMPFTFSAFLLGALSIIGLPPFIGMWSKWRLGEAIIMDGLSWSTWIAITTILLSSLLNVFYLLVIPMRAFISFRRERPVTQTIQEAPLLCVIPPCLTALACLILFFLIDPLASFLSPLTEGAP